jgi:4-amino-4-deoxy-L-arabinose transferase-like glycosyltransferase
LSFQAFKYHLNLRKKEWLLLLVIILGASFVRLWDLGANGFNNDEAIYGGQAASLAGYEEFEKHFSIYRAHPLLLQFMVSIIFGSFGILDNVARVVPAVLGILTVLVTYLIGKQLYDTKVALIAALVLALLPYHVILSRQVLLDVSLTFFFALTLYFLVRYLKKPQDIQWLFLVGASAGLTFLSKEVGIFALIVSIVSLILTRTITLRRIGVIVSAFLFATSPFWLPILTVPQAYDAAFAYWNWQTSRDQNQSADFYFGLIWQEALGYVLTSLVVFSIVYAVKTGAIKEPRVFTLMLWIGIPLVIFQFLTVKGYAFLLPIIPPFVLLGVSFLFSDWMKKVPHYRILVIIIVPLIFVFVGPMLHYIFQLPPIHLVGSEGEPYSRASALWIKDNLPQGVFLTLDTRTANVIKFYSNNDAVALHSNNNPAYTQIENPDLPILNGKINYLVYEAFLADQLPYLKQEAKELNQLVIKYNAVPVHIEYESVDGKKSTKPVLIIYALNAPNKSVE